MPSFPLSPARILSSELVSLVMVWKVRLRDDREPNALALDSLQVDRTGPLLLAPGLELFFVARDSKYLLKSGCRAGMEQAMMPMFCSTLGDVNPYFERCYF